MRRYFRVVGVFAVLAFDGCASLPDVTTSYYLPQASLQTTVVRTVACTAGGQPITASTVTSKVVYNRDPTTRQEVNIRQFDSAFADTSLTFTRTPDGRLAGINTSQTGQGEAIVKSLISLAGGLKAAALPSAATADVKKACTFINSTKDKMISLTFVDTDGFRNHQDLIDNGLTQRDIPPAPDSEEAYDLVKAVAGTVCIREAYAKNEPLMDKFNGTIGPAFVLKLTQPALVKVDVNETGADVQCTANVWTGIVEVPQLGQQYQLPIPTAALFGGATFKLALDDSGAVTTLAYTKNSSASSAITAATDITGALKAPTAADIAAEEKAKADIIAQQQRLIRCQKQPSSCV
jgi:hypothetical protein